MAKTGRTEHGIGDSYVHYDSSGHKTGRTEHAIGGGYVHYDSSGHKTGRTEHGIGDSYVHYDSNGHKTGRTEHAVGGGYVHYDSHGHKTGRSDHAVGGGYVHNDDACYVATCVYGSYDCPPVWTLRRFRDNTLAKSAPGRGFIRAYYAVSPAIVKWFGEAKWFHTLGRGMLDRLVHRLNRRGVPDTPYHDRQLDPHPSAEGSP